MYTQLAAKMGALGALALLLVLALVMAAVAYSMYENLRNALRSGDIQVHFYGQHDESLSRTETPFKFWFAFGLLCLALAFCGACAIYFASQGLLAMVAN